ncbi:HWE histidine kinase domain-containing protein [Sabulicella rubraurantiaca]|uniref:HWE histidine kinase domain-containing protein n=1 Tax=Sabulicella rubraurantiaca TaxID=2811429 RepID=UPI001A977978|nr:HWE histidine kinase domain-containing protein [Sabulicella rubraurantiaca]
MKNVLAVVHSLVALTLRATADGPSRFGPEFSARLGALARAHDLIARADWQPTDLAEVVRAALAPWRAAERPHGRR